MLGLHPRLEGLSEKPRVLNGLGAIHVVYRQYYRRYPVHKGFVTVHIDNFGRVYMCKCRAVPENRLPTRELFKWTESAIKAAAIRALSRRELRLQCGHKQLPQEIRIHSCKKQWFLDGGHLRPVWRIRLYCSKPKESWTLFFRADTKSVRLLEYFNGILLGPRQSGVTTSGARRQRSNWADGVGLVFTPNPVITTGRHEGLLETKTEVFEEDGKQYFQTSLKSKVKAPPFSAYHLVRLPELDPREKGKLVGKRVDVRVSKGNRIVGEVIRPRKDNLKGADFKYPTYRFMRFAGDQGFEEVMAYYYVDAAIQWLEKLGYTNSRYLFQTVGYVTEKVGDGKTKRRLAARAKPKKVVINVYHTHEDDAFYEPRTKQLYFGTGQISELEDAETLLHEFGHALQDHICNGFGATPQAAAMGEGFGDYFAASFCYDLKPEAWRPTVMSWDGILYGIERNENVTRGDDDARSIAFPPSLRRLDEPRTFEDFDAKLDCHHNGEIWAATLWDIREALGREMADKIIIDSHFELSTHTNFRRGARAIIHADENLSGGVNYQTLAQIFARRKINHYGQVQEAQEV